jgi:hypothetical protein
MELPPAPAGWGDSDNDEDTSNDEEQVQEEEEEQVDLELRRKEEKKAIGKYDTLKLKRKQCWFLVDVNWLQKWYCPINACRNA